ncbi:MAG: alpha-glucosidase C-terminal domain-containing protein [Paludibacter sp.]|nr:alpha-glucosidase C-terminal domain-containing protein [Paludibacter sp.]
MVQLRKTNKTLVYGKYELIDKTNPKIYAYTRGAGKNKLLILLNFSKENVNWKITNNLKLSNKILTNNYTDLIKTKNTISLKPYQAICIQLK